jgi:AraC-like DNA-binding protein
MIYQEVKPPPLLQGCVERYWILEANFPKAAEWEQAVIPTIQESVVFLYGDRFTVEDNTGIAHVGPQSLLIGQFTGVSINRLAGKIGAIGIHFKPAGFFRLFGIPSRHFTDGKTDLEIILGKEAHLLTEQIMEAKGLNQRVALLDQFLLKKAAGASLKLTSTEYAIGLIQARDGNLTVAGLADSVKVSIKSLERHFLERVGLYPKMFARIARFNATIRHVGACPHSTWHDVVHRFGYYDQAHFIKEFKKFSGKTPSDYFAGKIDLDRFFLGTPN